MCDNIIVETGKKKKKMYKQMSHHFQTSPYNDIFKNINSEKVAGKVMCPKEVAWCNFFFYSLLWGTTKGLSFYVQQNNFRSTFRSSNTWSSIHFNWHRQHNPKHLITPTSQQHQCHTGSRKQHIYDLRLRFFSQCSPSGYVYDSSATQISAGVRSTGHGRWHDHHSLDSFIFGSAARANHKRRRHRFSQYWFEYDCYTEFS